jgi:hypothetical protein
VSQKVGESSPRFEAREVGKMSEDQKQPVERPALPADEAVLQRDSLAGSAAQFLMEASQNPAVAATVGATVGATVTKVLNRPKDPTPPPDPPHGGLWVPPSAEE